MGWADWFELNEGLDGCGGGGTGGDTYKLVVNKILDS